MAEANRLPLATSPAPLLGYDADPTIRLAEAPRPLSLLLVVVGGLLAAAVGAGLIRLWLIAHIPFLLAGFALQGLLIGGALAWLGRRRHVSHRAWMMTLAAVCTLASIGGDFYFGRYLRIVYGYQTTERQNVEADLRDGNISATDAQSLLTEINQHPFEHFDRAIAASTGLRGFPGYLAALGPVVWKVMIYQLFIVLVIAILLARGAASHPYCVTCASWFCKPLNLMVLPAQYGMPLAEAMRAQDLPQLQQLGKLEDSELGTTCAIAELYTCRTCGLQIAGVAIKGARSKVLLTPRRVSADMVAVMRGKAAPFAESVLDESPESGLTRENVS